MAPAHADLRLARLRHHHGVPRPLRTAHPARPDAHAVGVVPDRRDAPRMGRLRGQHRVQPEGARRRAGGHGDGRRRRRRRTASASTRSASPATACARVPGTLHRAGVHHHRPRRQPDHRVSSGRDERVARRTASAMSRTSRSASSRPTAATGCARTSSSSPPPGFRSSSTRARACRCSPAPELIEMIDAATYVAVNDYEAQPALPSARGCALADDRARASRR